MFNVVCEFSSTGRVQCVCASFQTAAEAEADAARRDQENNNPAAGYRVVADCPECGRVPGDTCRC